MSRQGPGISPEIEMRQAGGATRLLKGRQGPGISPEIEIARTWISSPERQESPGAWHLA